MLHRPGDKHLLVLPRGKACYLLYWMNYWLQEKEAKRNIAAAIVLMEKEVSANSVYGFTGAAIRLIFVWLLHVAYEGELN